TSVSEAPSPRNDFFVRTDPSGGTITIGGAALSYNTVVGLRVTDASGRIALSAPRTIGSTFNVSELPAGVYVATVLNERNERIAGRAFVWCP
ncbi:MAG TPA: T9SS type A sorting domain-containing protein, partial [Flavobacteriales bacterium]|nr:T9SS type A sorting domain-containing protein [Flavobacteriales bacterium]